MSRGKESRGPGLRPAGERGPRSNWRIIPTQARWPLSNGRSGRRRRSSRSAKSSNCGPPWRGSPTAMGSFCRAAIAPKPSPNSAPTRCGAASTCCFRWRRCSARAPGEVVKVARMAGQFGKPRSTPDETVGGITLPTYRGDIVNGGLHRRRSMPDPLRMLSAPPVQGHDRPAQGLSAASYADFPKVHREAGLRTVRRRLRCSPATRRLLLNYEQALTRWDELSGAGGRPRRI